MREVDIKLLWGRAASRCSICKAELTQDSRANTTQFLIGEHAHIIGDKPGSARSNGSLSQDERERYHNRILLCPNHHSEIDKNETDYSVERLHQIKTDHELWVQNALGDAAPTPQQQAEQLAYALLVDSAVESCRLRTWRRWTSSALAPIPEWPDDLPEDAEKFAARVIGAVLPGRYPDLERAIATLARGIHEAAQHFLRHAELDERRKVWRANRFYRLEPWDRIESERLRLEWEAWVDECHALVILATKAANWLAEEVRRTLNPFFFLEEGKFLVTRGPDFDLSHSTELHEFTTDEKGTMPGAIVERLRERDEDPRSVK